MNEAITYNQQEPNLTVGAPDSEINAPSTGLSFAAGAYSAIMDGTSATIARPINKFILNNITDSDRPYLSQEQVNQLYTDNGLKNPPKADEYNDVALYYKLDEDKRRADADKIANEGSGLAYFTGNVVGSFADPTNIAAGLTPVGTAAGALGLAKVATSMEALKIAGQSGGSLLGRLASRFAYGAIEGATGNALLEGVTAPLRSLDNQEYDPAASLMNVTVGGIMGGGMHTIIGGIAGARIDKLSPKTRDAAFTTAVNQAENNIPVDVDAIIKADPMAKEQGLDASTIVKPVKNIDQSIKTEYTPSKLTNLDAEIADIQRQQLDIERLSNENKYSLKPQDELTQQAATDELNSFSKKIDVENEINRNFGDAGIKMLANEDIRVVDSFKEIPGEHPEYTRGVATKDGIYLVAENIDPRMVKGVVLHEAVHSLLRNDLGDELFSKVKMEAQRFLDNNPSHKQMIEAMIPKDTAAHILPEEKLAYLVQHAPELPFIQKLISKVKAWLFKKFPGLDLKLNDNDLSQLAMSAIRNYGGMIETDPTIKYSIGDEVKRIDNDIEEVNTELGKLNTLHAKLMNDATLTDIDDPKTFREYLQAEYGAIDETSSKMLQDNIGFYHDQAINQGLGNPEQYAVDMAMKQLKRDTEKYKLTLIHDRAVKQRSYNYLVKNWAMQPKAGLSSLVLGTVRYSDEGARAYTVGDSITHQRQIWTGKLNAALEREGVDKMFYSGSLNKDITKAMWAIEDGADMKGISKEAQTIAKLVLNTYKQQSDAMRANGYVVDSVKHYIANQNSTHNQLKIRSAGKDKWIASAYKLFDFNEMSNQMRIPVEKIDAEMLGKMYDGFATGDHIGDNGNIAGYGNGSFLRKVTSKPRKIAFKDADSLNEYRALYGEKDLHAAIISTVQNNAARLGILQTAGVNYERNLKEIAEQFISTGVNQEDRYNLRSWIDTTYTYGIKQIDGRMNRPVRESLARFNNDVRALTSMARLGKAMLSSINDLNTTASFLDRNGMHGMTYNIVDQLGKTFKHYTPEQKQLFSSLGVFSDSLIRDTFRDGNASKSTTGWVSSLGDITFKANLLEPWTQKRRLGALDSFMHQFALMSDNGYEGLDSTTKQLLKNYNIGEEEFNYFKSAPQEQINGSRYIIPDNLDKIRDSISSKYGDSTDRYISTLKNNLHNFYLDALSHMVMEPDMKTKFYTAGAFTGLDATSFGGQMFQYMTQFKSFSVQFLFKTLLDQYYDPSKSIWNKSQHFMKFTAANFILGYISMSLSDISSGLKPRPLFQDDSNKPDPKTVVAALLKGGGLGMFGDYLFGQFGKYGHSVTDTLIGAAPSTVADLAKFYYELTDTHTTWEQKSKRLATHSLDFVKSNLPMNNLFYAQAAMNYLFWYGAMEYLNPGYERRLEQNMQKNNNQEYWLQPTDSISY